MHQQAGLADIDFAAFKRKVKASYGLDLDAYKRPQMERRLRANMERCGAGTFQQYYSFLQKDPALVEEFLDRVTINVSELFRNTDQFEVLRTKVLPELFKRHSVLSVWSAGCSYGAEAHTLAILLREQTPDRPHSILGTDIDDKMLARARRGLFRDEELRNVSSARLKRFFQHTADGYEVLPELRHLMSFKKHDLLKDPFRTGFDLILCRNVVIYFTDEAKSDLYRRFHQSLAPGGFLFVGGTERVVGAVEIGFEAAYPFFYRKPLAH